MCSSSQSGFLKSIREHLISSQFFSKRNAFQIGFTPSLPPLSERLIAHFLTIIDVVLPQDLVYPRRNCSERVSCPSPQEKLQPTTSSPLLSRLLRSPSLCTHRLLCAWPPTVHQRQTRSIAGNQLVGPYPALSMPRGALRRLDRLVSGLRSISTRLELIFRGLSSDRAGRLRSIRTSKVSSKSIIIFLFCRKCAICDFPSETSATPLPSFRNALRLEKNCELMRCSLS